jgi:hypothetical protein
VHRWRRYILFRHHRSHLDLLVRYILFHLFRIHRQQVLLDRLVQYILFHLCQIRRHRQDLLARLVQR